MSAERIPAAARRKIERLERENEELREQIAKHMDVYRLSARLGLWQAPEPDQHTSRPARVGALKPSRAERGGKDRR